MGFFSSFGKGSHKKGSGPGIETPSNYHSNENAEPSPLKPQKLLSTPNSSFSKLSASRPNRPVVRSFAGQLSNLSDADSGVLTPKPDLTPTNDQVSFKGTFGNVFPTFVCKR